MLIKECAHKTLSVTICLLGLSLSQQKGLPAKRSSLDDQQFLSSIIMEAFSSTVKKTAFINSAFYLIVLYVTFVIMFYIIEYCLNINQRDVQVYYISLFRMLST
jgi:hypothetical protein